jgi:hypothetical protein
MQQVFTFGHQQPQVEQSSASTRSRDKTVVGGKGANLAEMTGIGLPVPPGFTITTEECLRYLTDGGDFSANVQAEVAKALAHIEQITDKKFGDITDPLLVSVRSGARVSMPGMMDTVLNLGLNDQTGHGLAATSSDARFAWDSYSPLHPDVFRRCAGTEPSTVRKRFGSRQGRQWLLRRYRNGRGTLASAREGIPGHRRGRAWPFISAGCPRTAVGRDPRSVR